MTSPLHAAYAAAMGSAAYIARFASPAADSKIVRSLAARRGIRARYAAWASEFRDSDRPLLWLHAPSVGEGLQARPVADLLRERRPDVQLAYTYFSPSAERFAASIGADFTDYLPFDTTADARAALDALRPTALVFSKLDVWPMLVGAASLREVRLGLVSATLAAASSRRTRGVAALLRPAYSALHRVGAVSGDDADRLLELGVRGGAVTVTGDARYDQVWARAQRASLSAPLLAGLASERPTLVAGSTWPADERQLLPAWQLVRRQLPAARLILAPHEPTATHLASPSEWAARAGLTVARLGAPGERDADVVLVDRVGVLGELYALADVAYVGGGFHSAGLHSVLEPAAFGAPVIFGPRHASSRDAALLIEADAAQSAGSTNALAAALSAWLRDPSGRRAAGERARATVQAGLGAAERSYSLVEELLRA